MYHNTVPLSRVLSIHTPLSNCVMCQFKSGPLRPATLLLQTHKYSSDAQIKETDYGTIHQIVLSCGSEAFW